MDQSRNFVPSDVMNGTTELIHSLSTIWLGDSAYCPSWSCGCRGNALLDLESVGSAYSAISAIS